MVMQSIANTLGPFVLAALVAWFVLGPLLRLTAIACFVTATAGLAVGDAPAAAGITAVGAACAIVSHLLFRARHGRWRTSRLEHLAAHRRRRGTSQRAGTRRPG